jgi:hypothetical protein
MDFINDLTTHLTTWHNLSASPHRYGGIEYRLHNTEIGHIHRGGQVDILFSRAIRQQLVAENKAELHHILPESGWITFRVHTASDIQHAIWLFRLSYLQKQVRLDRGLTWDDPAIQAELSTLNLSNDLRLALLVRPARSSEVN